MRALVLVPAVGRLLLVTHFPIGEK
jgi:hypothetical protein